MGVPVSVLLDRKGTALETLPLDATVRDVVERLTARNIGAIVIEGSEGTLAGIVSERDVVRELASAGPSVLDVAVSVVMTGDVETCTPDTSTDELMRIMTDRRIRHIPVVDGEWQLVGIVSIGDVVKWQLDELSMEAKHLADYVRGGNY
jgi:CBS domain-containing protein